MGERHYRRGVNVELHAFEARRLIDHVDIGDAAIPLVRDGTILEIARDSVEMQISSSVQPVGQGMNSDNITITVTLQPGEEPVQIGVPRVSIANEQLLTFQLLQHLTPEAATTYREQGEGAFEWEDPSVQMVATSRPLDIRVHYACQHTGSTKLVFIIPIPGFCDLRVAWEKQCSGKAVEAQKPSSGGLGPFGWLLILGISGCCCFCCCGSSPQGGLHPDEDPVAGEMRTMRIRPMDDADDKRPWTWNEVQYAAYGLYSQVRQIRDEALSGQLRLADLPFRIRQATSRPLRDASEETQEML